MSVRPKYQKLRLVVARRVREERDRRKWSQERLGEMANLTQAYISQLEYGKRAVTIDVIEALAQAFRVDPATLLTP